MYRLIFILISSIFATTTIQFQDRLVSFDRYLKTDFLLNNVFSLSYIGIDISDQEVRYKEDIINEVEHYIVHQKINNIPVFGRSVRVHFSNQSNFASISIDFFDGDLDSPMENLSQEDEKSSSASI